MRVKIYAIILLCAALLCTFAYDSFFVYPHSTHLLLEIDLTSVSGGDPCYYTTNEGTISMCLDRGVWTRKNFIKAIATSPSRFEAMVGAVKPKSAVRGADRGKPMWYGRILIVCHSDKEPFNAFLVTGSPKCFRVEVKREHLWRGNVDFID